MIRMIVNMQIKGIRMTIIVDAEGESIQYDGWPPAAGMRKE